MNRRNSNVTTVLLARRARALERHLRSARAGDGHGIHQARVASRRLREAVPVLAPGVKRRKADKARREIRRLTRALGTVRELDVTLGHLDELATSERLPRLALEDVRAHVVSEREGRRGLMLKRLARVDVGKLKRRLASVGIALEESDGQLWRPTLASRLVKRSKALAKAMEAAGRMYAPEPLHAVRIAAKKLRYALELAADAGITAAAAPLRTLKRAQDTLGRLQDLQVLQGHVAAVQAAPAGRSPNARGLEVVHRALEDDCRHLHAQYVAAVPSLQGVVEVTRREVVAQLAQRRMGSALKMTLAGRASRHTGAAAPRAAQRA